MSAVPPDVEAELVEAADVLDLLDRLVEKSLVAFDGGEGRYRLTETVRQYAEARLAGAREAESVSTAFLQWALKLAEEAEPRLRGPDQAEWLARLEAENDNLRVAVALAFTRPDPLAALRLTGALACFWFIRGHVTEGREHLRRALERAPEVADDRASVLAMVGAGSLAYQQRDYAAAEAYWRRALALRRAHPPARGIAALLNNLGVIARDRGEYAAAEGYHREALEIRRRIGDTAGVAASMNNLGLLAADQGRDDEARAHYEESLALQRSLGDAYGEAITLNNLGKLAYERADFPAARTWFEQGLALRRPNGDQRGIAMSLISLGSVAHEQEACAEAEAIMTEALTISREISDRWLAAFALDGLANAAYARGDEENTRDCLLASLQLRREIDDRPGITHSLFLIAAWHERTGRLREALCLWAAADALREQLGTTLLIPTHRRDLYERELERARETLGDAAFTTAWSEGWNLSLEEAAAIAFQPAASAVERRQPPGSDTSGADGQE